MDKRVTIKITFRDGRPDVQVFRMKCADFAQAVEVANSFNVDCFQVLEFHIYKAV